MATEGTKFQINYKVNDGTLINWDAASVRELESDLADLAMNAMNIRATGLEQSGGSGPAPAPTVAAVAASFNATPVQAAPAPVAAGGNACKHGPMTFKTGTSTKGPWQGWMCPTPKGAPDKCDTIWVR